MKAPAVAAVIAVLLAASGSSRASALAQADAPWSSQVVMTAPAKLGGCAVGDLDPAHPGNEIVSVCVTGQVFLSRPDRGRWVSEPIVQAQGELLQCAIGDADPERPGNELVVVGMKQGTEGDGGKGVAYLVYRTEKDVDGKPRVEWVLEPLCESKALIHTVAIADVDPDSTGPEVITAGFSKNYHVWTKRDGAWTSLKQVPLPGNAKSVVHFQDAVAVACDDGSLILDGPGGWIGSEDGKGAFNEAPSGQARLGTGGERLIAARDDGKLVVITAAGVATEIYAERQKLRGAVLADLDPEHPGLEAATAGYGLKMTVLYPITGEGGEVLEWIPRLVHTDVDRFHHLAVGELDPKSPGLEIVGCGYSGRVIVAGKSPQ